MLVAEALVHALTGAGIDTVFGVPGGACSAISDALLRAGVRLVTCQGETMAGYLAAGWHRATSRPGILLVTSGPGVLAAAASLAAARLDQDGVIVLAGDVARPDRGRGTLQDGGPGALDVLSALRPLVGHVRRVEQPYHAQPLLAEALRRATAPTPSPSLLEIPIDVQRMSVEPMVVAGGPAPRVAPEEAAVRALADAILSGRRPTLLIGRGAARGGAGPAVVALAERLGAPMVVDAEARGAVPRRHPLLVGTYGIGDDGRAHAWIRDNPAEPLIVLGARLDDTTTAGFSAELLGGRIVQIDEDPACLGRAVPVAVGLAADLALAAQALTRCLPAAPAAVASARAEAVRALHQAVRAQPAPLGQTPFQLCAAARALREAFPAGTTFTSDIGDHLLAALREVEVDEPGQFHFSLGLGGMGSGIGLAMGLALGGREKVVGMCGDGGVLMFGNELFTAVKHQAPLVLAVFQDGQLGMVRHGAQRVYGASDPYSLAGFDVEGWARSLGADVLRADHPAAFVEAGRREIRRPLVLVIPIDPESRVSNPRDISFNFSPTT